MTTPDEIRKLALMRLDEAKILYQNGKCDGSFYLAGYSVELMLKAKICERLGIPNLYDESDKSTNSISGIGELRKTLKTHNLYLLLVISGLKNKFDQDKAKNINLAKSNSLLFSNWDENARYKPCGHMKDKDVETFIKLLGDPKGILKWIEQN